MEIKGDIEQAIDNLKSGKTPRRGGYTGETNKRFKEQISGT